MNVKIAERNFRELAIFRPIKSFTQEKSPSLARPAANVTLKKGPENILIKGSPLTKLRFEHEIKSISFGFCL